MPQDRIGHYLSKNEKSLLECLVGHFGLTSEQGESLLTIGAVYQDRQRAKSDQALSPGQYVRVHLQPKRFPVERIDWRKTAVHHDEDFLVVNKPQVFPCTRLWITRWRMFFINSMSLLAIHFTLPNVSIRKLVALSFLRRQKSFSADSIGFSPSER
jgi:hypothetical protein